MYTIEFYEIYEGAENHTSYGKYYGKADSWELAEKIVADAKMRNKIMFIKAVCSDGRKRPVL